MSSSSSPAARRCLQIGTLAAIVGFAFVAGGAESIVWPLLTVGGLFTFVAGRLL